MRTKSKGFTLIEMLIVITLTGVLLGVAIPNFSDWTQKRRTIGAGEALLQFSYSARSDAIRLGEPVRIYVNPTTRVVCAERNASADGSCDVRVFPASDLKDQTLTTSSDPSTTLLVYDSVRGIATPPSGTPTVTLGIAGLSGSLRLNIGMLGNGSLCRTTSDHLGGYAACAI